MQLQFGRLVVVRHSVRVDFDIHISNKFAIEETRAVVMEVLNNHPSVLKTPKASVNVKQLNDAGYVIGEVIFENEKGFKEILIPGDYVNIETNVKHWVTAKKDSNLLLTK